MHCDYFNIDNCGVAIIGVGFRLLGSSDGYPATRNDPARSNDWIAATPVNRSET
jgi:hypothetical protein